MSLLIKNGEIVTASERYVADILCENETITRIWVPMGGQLWNPCASLVLVLQGDLMRFPFF